MFWEQSKQSNSFLPIQNRKSKKHFLLLMMKVNNYDYFHYTIYCTNCHRRALEFINNISRIILILIIGLHVLSKLTSENNSKTIIRKRKSIPNFALIYTNQSCSFYTLFELPHYNKHNVHRRNYPV